MKKFPVKDEQGNLLGYCTNAEAKFTDDYIKKPGPFSEVDVYDSLVIEGYEPPSGGDWHDLTAAIKAGEPIDWEALDGRKAKCVHETMGALIYKLELDHEFEEDIIDVSDAWWPSGCPHQWPNILNEAWCGNDGWTLLIDGPVPLKRKTADQLEPGTCFHGSHSGEEYVRAYFVYDSGEQLIVRGITSGTSWRAQDVEVIEEYGIGTFKSEATK